MSKQDKIGRFILTEYIYPLNEPIMIFGNFLFDNLRNFEEIKLVGKGLQQIIDSYNKFAPVGMHINEEVLEKHFEKAISVNDNDEGSLKNSKNYKSIYHRIASTIVIMRQQNHELQESHSVQSLEDNQDEIQLDDSFEKIKKLEQQFDKAKHIVDFVVFSTFHSWKYQYKHDTIFTFDYFSPFNIRSEILVIDLHDSYAFLPFLINRGERDNSDYKKMTFPEVYKKIKPILNSVSGKIDDPTMLYIADNLAHLSGIENDRITFVMIVSLLESLVAHKPDNKFNVDESIRKQFSDKISLLFYLETKNDSTKGINKELKLIYDLRSSIAHGSYNQINETLTTLNKHYMNSDPVYNEAANRFKKTYSNVDQYMFHSLNRAKYFLRIVLRRYLEDQKLLEIIKSDLYSQK